MDICVRCGGKDNACYICGDPPGAERISLERHRQILVENWRSEHDDTHDKGELLMAAVCYIRATLPEMSLSSRSWPWGMEWWRPSENPIRNLEKAGALIAAEIDRLRRKI